MKILSSFDTKLDEKILKEKLEKHKEAFMIKRHYLYLFKMIWYVLLIFIFLSLLIIILNKLLDFYAFLIIVLLNLFWLWIWIWLTVYQLWKYLKNYEFFKSEITKEDLEDWLLEKYFKFSFFLFAYQIILSIITTILSFYSNIHWWLNFTNILLNIIQIILNLLFLYFIYKTLYVLINFEMDFVMITDENISLYDQTWIFKRKSTTIWVDKIKSINASKKWIIRSFFDFWEIKILTEWDDQNWEITLKYIPQPEKVKNKIIELMHI